MPDERPVFGVTEDGLLRLGYLSKDPAVWLDSELTAGLAQISARLRRHPEYAAELTELSAQLTREQQRRRDLYADIASVFIDSQDTQ